MKKIFDLYFFILEYFIFIMFWNFRDFLILRLYIFDFIFALYNFEKTLTDMVVGT